MDTRTAISLPKITVLLVDADITFASIVQNHLQRFQEKEFILIWKENAEEALMEIRQNQDINIIVADILLPGTSGLEFYLQLTQIGIDIPFIFAASTTNLRNAIDAMKVGVEDYVLKDQLSESILPRTIVTAYESATRRKNIQAVEKRMMIAQKKAEAIRELVVTVCHEFNNPLAAIKISTDLLLRQPMSDSERKLLQVLEHNIEKIESVVRRLHDINFEKDDDKKPSLNSLVDE